MYEDSTVAIQCIIDESSSLIEVLKKVFIRVIVYSDMKMRVIIEMSGFVDVEVYN